MAPWTRSELLELCASDPERVVDLVFEFWDHVGQLTQQVEQWTTRVHDWERQVNQNSQNSSQPPSQDGYRKPAPKSLRGKTDKLNGGQPGHPGTRLEMREDPDHIVVHRPTQCDGCGQELDSGSVVDAARRQVYDLVARIAVTEHQAVTVTCPHCQATTAAPFPATIPATVQYGPALKSFLSYGSV